jgi:predicted XRE-type DNA-binding protein
LAAPSTPQEARDEAIEKAEAGERVTHKTSKEIVAKHKQPLSKPQKMQRQWDEMQKAKPDAIEGVDYRVVDDQWGFRHREPISDTETDAEVGRRLAEKVRDFSEIRRAITELVDKIAEYVEWQRRTSVPLHHLREDVERDTKRWRRLLKDRAGWEAFLFGSIYDAIMCPADDDEPVVPAHGNGEAEPENDQDQVRQQLRDTISAHRMTAKDFALRAGVPQPRLSVFMNGKNLRAKNLGKVVHTLEAISQEQARSPS